MCIPANRVFLPMPTLLTFVLLIHSFISSTISSIQRYTYAYMCICVGIIFVDVYWRTYAFTMQVLFKRRKSTIQDAYDMIDDEIASRFLSRCPLSVCLSSFLHSSSMFLTFLNLLHQYHIYIYISASASRRKSFPLHGINAWWFVWMNAFASS